MKKVLITTTAYPYSMGDKPGVVDGLRPTMLKKFMDRGLVPLLASAVMNEEAIDQLYDMADGVVFSGGADVNPKYYGQTQHKNTQAHENERDIMEIRLINKVLKDKKPFVGICRGMQILNIVQGGSLYQYMPEIFNGESHGSGTAESTGVGNPASRKAKILSGTRLSRVISKTEIELTCNHKQAVDKLGNNLRQSAKTDTNVVEVIEHLDSEYFCFGIQSHPEAQIHNDFDPLFDAFRAEINKR